MLSLLFTLLLLPPVSARADCASPAGLPGELRYAAPELQYCDSTLWRSTAVAATATACTRASEIVMSAGKLHFCNGTTLVSMDGASVGSSCPVGNLGELKFDSASSTMRWCNGANWKYTQGDASATYVGASPDIVDSATYTYPSVALGAAAPDRVLVIGFAARSASTFTASSLTVGGVAATLVGQTQAGSVAGFYMVPYPTGTSANIVVNYTGTMVRAGIAVWAVRNLRTAPVSTGGALVGNPATLALNMPAGGVGFAIAYNNNGSGFAWSGLSASFTSTNPDAANNLNYSGSTGAFASAQTVSASVAGTQSNFAGYAITLR